MKPTGIDQLAKPDRERKRGVLSVEELRFIDEHLRDYSDEEIGNMLNRNSHTIAKRRAQVTHGLTDQQNINEDYIRVLHGKHYWLELKRQLLPHEVGFFEQEWGSYMTQFPDVVHTDENMIIDTIMMTININRALAEKATLLQQIDAYQDIVKTELDKKPRERDKEMLSEANQQLNALRAALQSSDKKYLDIQQRKDAKFQHLKATREQRFKSMQDSKKNIFELIKLLDERENRLNENRMLSLFQDATEQESSRLSQLTQYEDGSFDAPLLNFQTVERMQSPSDEEPE